MYFDSYKLLNSFVDLYKLNQSETTYKQIDGKLRFQIIEKTSIEIIISIAKYREENGDMIADPEFIIKVNLDKKFVEAISYQDQFGFRPVYFTDGTIDIEARYEINSYLKSWLTMQLDTQ